MAAVDYVYAAVMIAAIGVYGLVASQLYYDMWTEVNGISDDAWFAARMADIQDIDEKWDTPFLLACMMAMFSPLMGSYFVRGHKLGLPISIIISIFAIITSVAMANMHYYVATDDAMTQGLANMDLTTTFVNLLPLWTAACVVLSLILFYGKPDQSGYMYQGVGQ